MYENFVESMMTFSGYTLLWLLLIYITLRYIVFPIFLLVIGGIVLLGTLIVAFIIDKLDGY
jgi:hypothetical protein